MGNNSRDCVMGCRKTFLPHPFSWASALYYAIHASRPLGPYTTLSHSGSAKEHQCPFVPLPLEPCRGPEQDRAVSSTNAIPVKPAVPRVLWWTSSLCSCVFSEHVSACKAWRLSSSLVLVLVSRAGLSLRPSVDNSARWSSHLQALTYSTLAMTMLPFCWLPDFFFFAFMSGLTNSCTSKI